MDMKKILLYVICLFVLFLFGCNPPGGSTPDNGGIIKLSIGESHDFNGILIKINQVFWLELNPIYVPLQNAIGIEVNITNNKSASVDYLSIYSWGVLLESTGYQLNDAWYIGLINAEEFSGDHIVPGGTITDTIPFEEYTDSPTSFTFKGEAPILDCDYFEILFNLSDVVIKP
jgi:hypothetical protein